MQAARTRSSLSTRRGMRTSSLVRAATANRRTCVSVAATMQNSRTAELRKLLRGNEILLGPCCHDALSARLIEQAGFPYAFMSGFCTAGARLGAPDTGLISYAEMVDTGRNIHEATRSLPVIGDGDTGYGNAMNVKRTVRGYAQAGFAGILIEDQVAPKSCGHVRGKRVVGREEAVGRIRAAVDAREEGADILIVARTDARQAVSLEEAFWRAQAFAEAGADVLFIDALESEEEMAAFCALGGAAAGVPKMANMLEGGGRTPVLPPSTLQAMGFKLVAYPLSLLGVSVRAMQDALLGLKRGRVPPVEALGTFADIQAAVGFPEYYEEEARYATRDPTPTPMRPEGHPPVAEAPQRPPPPPPPPRAEAKASGSAGPSALEVEVLSDDSASSSSTLPTAPQPSASSTSSSTGSSTGSGADAASRRRNLSLRVRISDAATGLVKLETRVPAGFLNGLSALVPQVAGVELEALLKDVMGPGGAMPPPGTPLLNLPTGNDIVQIFLE